MTDFPQDADKIIGFIKEIGEEERHFNNVSSTYKTMASTWLLAVFGGIGFILANAIEPKLLLTAGIGLAGGIGIFLLWLMDMRVYQQLLVANFVEGLRMEKENSWLPQVRKNMIETQLSGSVTQNLAWFYLLGIAIPLIVFLYSIGNFLFISEGILYSLIFVVTGGILLLYILDKIRSASKEDSLEKAKAKDTKKKEEKDKEKKEKKKRFQFISVGFLIYLIGFLLIKVNAYSPKDYLAPDKSEIRLLPSMNGGGMAHCVLPPHAVSSAVEHKTVEEIWYILSGSGEIWRKRGSEEQVVSLLPQTCITIPVHTQFQFRNTGPDSLKILICTMPPWPGASEAIRVKDFWALP